MIKLLDKYIIKKFLSTYFFTLAIIMLLSMVFDISARLSEFIEKKAPLKTIFTDYYLNFLVYYGNTFSALIVFQTSPRFRNYPHAIFNQAIRPYNSTLFHKCNNNHLILSIYYKLLTTNIQ